MSFSYKDLCIKSDAKLESLIHHPNAKKSHTVNIQKYFLLLRNFYLIDELQLEGTLDSELQLLKAQQKPFFYQFLDTLARGAELMGRNISPLEPFLTYRYALQILCLEDEIYEIMDLMLTHILLDARKLKKEQQDFYLELQPEDVRSLLTIDAFPSTKLLQQMRLDDLDETSEMEEGFTYSAYDFAAMKRPLFQNEVSVIGVRCMTGYFQTLFFITVSQSANVKGFLETLWDNIIERKRSDFQNLEDVRMQLQQQLLRQSKSTLLILDDVRSRANLEKLLFIVAGYKTLFTTRDSFIIPRSHPTQFLLGQEDALSLFCLHGEPCEAWESANSKLPKWELVRSTAAISHGNASELYFSQHDIIRDLALHLGGQGIAFQRNRLLVPREENILPWKWDLQKKRPFDAQIVSVHTGPMDKSNWYENNFPKIEGHNKRSRCLIFIPSTKERA